MFRIVKPPTSRRGKIIRHLLLVEIEFVSGNRFLVGELQRCAPSDNFAVFCCESNFADASALTEFLDALHS